MSQYHPAVVSAVPPRPRKSRKPTKGGAQRIVVAPSKPAESAKSGSAPSRNCQAVIASNGIDGPSRFISTDATAKLRAEARASNAPTSPDSRSWVNAENETKTTPTRPRASATTCWREMRSPRTVTPRMTRRSGCVLPSTLAMLASAFPGLRNIVPYPTAPAVSANTGSQGQDRRGMRSGWWVIPARRSRLTPATSRRNAAKRKGGAYSRPMRIAIKQAA